MKIDFFFTVAVVLAILGKTSLPCFPELSWAGVQALSVSGSGRYYCCIPASPEPLSLIPAVRPLPPPAHFTSQRKKNLFQRTCWEWRLLSSVNSFTLLHVVVHLLLIIYIWDHMGCPANTEISIGTLSAPSLALGFIMGLSLSWLPSPEACAWEGGYKPWTCMGGRKGNLTWDTF